MGLEAEIWVWRLGDGGCGGGGGEEGENSPYVGNEPWLMLQEKRDKMQYQKFEPAFQDVP